MLNRGLTLIEVCVVLALVALLASLAWPSWSQASRKTRRAEAISALLSLQQSQEQRFAVLGSYTDDLSALGWPSGTTASGTYRLAVAQASSAGYTATASVIAGTAQASDTPCAVFVVRWLWGQASLGSACAECTSMPVTDTSTAAMPPAPLTDPARCWSQ